MMHSRGRGARRWTREREPGEGLNQNPFDHLELHSLGVLVEPSGDAEQLVGVVAVGDRQWLRWVIRLLGWGGADRG